MAREIPLHWIDAFSSEPFAGNPAAVCLLADWLPDQLLQQIATENGLSETAYLVGGGGDYELRWFTPACEVDLCGHATLASGFVVLTDLDPALDRVRFRTRQAGELSVTRAGGRLELDFPSRPATPADDPAVAAAIGRDPDELYETDDAYLAVYSSADEVEALWPDMASVAALDKNLNVTAGGTGGVDFVSRYFAPAAGIPEDPVTGSAHCTLTPYWSRRLGKRELRARQISPRGGDLWVTDRGDRIGIAGHAVRYLRGSISV
jgi:PhzF family phenazine biosynthesis protein